MGKWHSNRQPPTPTLRRRRARVYVVKRHVALFAPASPNESLVVSAVAR